jgi:DNA-binding response OmpR family regulator
MSGGTETVLVVDDEAPIRLLCRLNLELEGYRVVEAATLADARAILDGGDDDIAVVLLDVHVGADDGRDFLRELRAEEPALPVAMFTGSADIDTIKALGADSIIPKPFEPAKLVETVRRLVAGAR